MPKRKRSSPAPRLSRPANPATRQKNLCNARLTAAQKPLVAALRLGAGFERQKHSRRKKTAVAKKDAKATERLEAEYAVLKGLDMEKLADQHLRRTVGKVKSLKDAEALKEYVEGLEKGSAVSSEMLNVTARLYKVDAVRKVVDEVVGDLKAILEVGDKAGQVKETVKKSDAKEKKQGKAVEKEDVGMLDISDEEGDPYDIFSARIAAPSSGEEDSEASVTDDERPPSIADSESEHDPDDDLEADSESEPDADSFEAFSDDDDTKASTHMTTLSRSVAPPSDLSDSDADSEDIAIAPKKKSKAEPQITGSAFIPGLSHANYISGSDSDASDLDVDIAPRKNRRGQRARQKIAEAKFGAGAKHLEKQRRNEGWDPKRGAVGEERRGPGDRVPKGRGPQQSGTNAEPLGDRRGAGAGVVKKKERDDKGVLHPSWQAAKQAKESKKLKIEIGGGKTGAKKVVFD
ncbi:Bud-site selection protein [Plenodomus tracheiphilus IPT5]|uniref:Bud-site selection protein n=1 Tax=Plenodomus tracheiphilus IPT5 TaxID=1408161 RepID=A0A6A7B2Y0_9PLEO|nr:Bud-site selection protein [Plenodomus tracheiphilus IPT5]